jgi:glutathione S-transferase
MEGCPYCRPVREALSELDLDAVVYPCPKGGCRFRPRGRELTGRERFPILFDPNDGIAIGEMRRVLEHLYRRYAGRTVPLRYRVGWSSSHAASGIRHLRGLYAQPSRAPDRPLELWSFESSPFSRLVRERLTELEIPYYLHNLGKEQVSDIGPPEARLTLREYAPVPGGKREALGRLGGKIQVPYLVDPNGPVAMYESRDILDYLDRTYAA